MKLYIFGNGFDIAHGLKTSFADFKDFLKVYQLKNRNDIDLVRELYKNLSDDDWNDFERNIANVDIQTISEFSKIFSGLDFISFTLPLTLQQVMCAFIEQAIKKWKENIKFILDTNSIVLSFNYTDLPLHLYGIQYFNFFPIHGSYSSAFLNNEERFIMGHGYSDFNYNFEFLKANNDYQKFIKRLEKPVDSIIKEDRLGFFKKLREEAYKIDEVVIFGYSYSDIDNRYLTTILKILKSNIKIVAYYQTKKDLEKLSNFLSNYKKQFVIQKQCSIGKRGLL